MPNISKITLPNNLTYDIKDTTARTDISNIQTVIGSLTGANVVVFRGVSSTVLTDGGNQNPTINNSAVTSKRTGDVYFYGTEEFIYGSDNKWHALGSLDTLGAMAYVDKGTVTITPHGSISKPNITMNALSAPVAPRYLEAQGNVGTTQANYATGHTSNSIVYYQPEGAVSTPAFIGKTITSTGTFTPGGSVQLVNNGSDSTNSIALSINNITPPTSQGQDPSVLPGYFKPQGIAQAQVISLKTAGATTTIKNPTKVTVAKTVAVAPPGTPAPSNNLIYYGYDTANETLKLYQMGYTTGDSITTTDVTVKTGDAAYQAAGSALDITPRILTTTYIKANWIPQVGQDISVSGTTDGTISTPVFTGTKVVLTAHGTPTGSLNSAPTFTGTQETWTVNPSS